MDPGQNMDGFIPEIAQKMDQNGSDIVRLGFNLWNGGFDTTSDVLQDI